MDGAGTAGTGVGTVAVETIITGSGVVGINATGGSVTGITGADIAVITIEGRSTHTGPIGTGICYRTSVTIITGIGVGVV